MPFQKGHFGYFEHHSETTKKKISKANKGRHFSPLTEFKKGHIGWGKGKSRSEEIRNKIRKALKGRFRGIHRSLHTEFKKGNIPWSKGKHLSEENKQKLLEANFGRHPSKKVKKKISRTLKRKGTWLKGKHLSEKAKQNLRLKNLGKKHSKETKEKIGIISKGHWKNSEYVKKWIRGNLIRPNKKEEKLNSYLQKILPSEYALNIKAEIMILSGKIPDFVNVNGKKKLIELYGDYWHRNDNPQDRINLFKKFGWDTLVVWEKELKNLNLLKEKILEFNKV